MPSVPLDQRPFPPLRSPPRRRRTPATCRSSSVVRPTLSCPPPRLFSPSPPRPESPDPARSGRWGSSTRTATCRQLAPTQNSTAGADHRMVGRWLGGLGLLLKCSRAEPGQDGRVAGLDGRLVDRGDVCAGSERGDGGWGRGQTVWRCPTPAPRRRRRHRSRRRRSRRVP